jgi:hypothetical protein
MLYFLVLTFLIQSAQDLSAKTQGAPQKQKGQFKFNDLDLIPLCPELKGEGVLRNIVNQYNENPQDAVQGQIGGYNVEFTGNQRHINGLVIDNKHGESELGARICRYDIVSAEEMLARKLARKVEKLQELKQTMEQLKIETNQYKNVNEHHLNQFEEIKQDLFREQEENQRLIRLLGQEEEKNEQLTQELDQLMKFIKEQEKKSDTTQENLKQKVDQLLSSIEFIRRNLNAEVADLNKSIDILNKKLNEKKLNEIELKNSFEQWRGIINNLEATIEQLKTRLEQQSQLRAKQNEQIVQEDLDLLNLSQELEQSGVVSKTAQLRISANEPLLEGSSIQQGRSFLEEGSQREIELNFQKSFSLSQLEIDDYSQWIGQKLQLCEDFKEGCNVAKRYIDEIKEKELSEQLKNLINRFEQILQKNLDVNEKIQKLLGTFTKANEENQSQYNDLINQKQDLLDEGIPLFNNIQSLAKQEKIYTKEEEAAAIKIQAFLKGMLERQKFLKKREAATKIQAVARGNAARKKLQPFVKEKVEGIEQRGSSFEEERVSNPPVSQILNVQEEAQSLAASDNIEEQGSEVQQQQLQPIDEFTDQEIDSKIQTILQEKTDLIVLFNKVNNPSEDLSKKKENYKNEKQQLIQLLNNIKKSQDNKVELTAQFRKKEAQVTEIENQLKDEIGKLQNK